MWSPQSRVAAAASRKSKGRTKPHQVLGSQGAPAIGSKPGKPMKAPGVAKPTGPHAFTGGKQPKYDNSPNTSVADARRATAYKQQARSAVMKSPKGAAGISKTAQKHLGLTVPKSKPKKYPKRGK
jgi:hypothetical protein